MRSRKSATFVLSAARSIILTIDNMNYICQDCGEPFTRHNNQALVDFDENICNKCATYRRQEMSNNDIFYNNFQDKEYA